MSNVKKIELALADLTAALVEHLNNNAHGCARQAIRLEKLERAAVEEKRLEDYLHSAHRRIADLESAVKAAHRRIDELENVAEEDPRSIIADMINDGDIRLHVD